MYQAASRIEYKTLTIHFLPSFQEILRIRERYETILCLAAETIPDDPSLLE
jgi:hypothetical protein